MRSKSILLAFVVALCWSCFGTDTGLLFSHGEHPEQIEDEEGFAECTACHELTSDGTTYTLPSHQGATGCYGPDGGCHFVAVPIEEARENPSRFCKECHTRETGEVIWHEHVYSDVRFAHADHDEGPGGKPVSCVRCHELPIDRDDFGDITRSKLSYPVAMEACIDCHTQQAASVACETCHLDRRRDARPPSHDGAAFLQTHGPASERSIANCQWCHEGSTRVTRSSADLSSTSFCIECHRTQRPRSHVARWDQTLHGRMARHDRRRCITCHEVETCQACHAVAPRSHSMPRFQNPGDGHQRFARANVRSCLACHVYAADCAECHSN